MLRTLVYVGAAGHSGTTMLDLLLNNSPDIQAVGEISRLSWMARSGHSPCSCGVNVSECPFWTRVEAEARAEMGVGPDAALLNTRETMLEMDRVSRFGLAIESALLVAGSRGLYQMASKFVARCHYEATANSWFWYDMTGRVAGKPILVETSKDPRRLKALYLYDPTRFRLIYMVRDGRAVSASQMRREKVGMEVAATAWRRVNQRLRWAMWTIPDAQRMFLSYEELCRNPRETMERVARFVGTEVNDNMLVLRKTESHSISGNPMRFRRDERAIELDERWKTALSVEDLATFERIAGRLNRQLGNVG